MHGNEQQKARLLADPFDSGWFNRPACAHFVGIDALVIDFP